MAQEDETSPSSLSRFGLMPSPTVAYLESVLATDDRLVGAILGGLQSLLANHVLYEDPFTIENLVEAIIRNGPKPPSGFVPAAERATLMLLTNRVRARAIEVVEVLESTGRFLRAENDELELALPEHGQPLEFFEDYLRGLEAVGSNSHGVKSARPVGEQQAERKHNDPPPSKLIDADLLSRTRVDEALIAATKTLYLIGPLPLGKTKNWHALAALLPGRRRPVARYANNMTGELLDLLDATRASGKTTISVEEVAEHLGSKAQRKGISKQMQILSRVLRDLHFDGLEFSQAKGDYPLTRLPLIKRCTPPAANS